MRHAGNTCDAHDAPSPLVGEGITAVDPNSVG